MKRKRSGLVLLGLLSAMVLGGCAVVPSHPPAYRSTGYSTQYGHGDAGYRSGHGYGLGHGGTSGMGYGHRGRHH